MSDYTTPILYMLKRPGTPRPWLMSETPALFSLANIGSYNQRLINQLLSVCREMSHSVDRKSTRLNSSHKRSSRMPSSA